MLENIFDNVREKKPLIHNITNYVTVNDCANMLLACGASPIMADDMDEVEDITSICNGLNINIGTLNKRTIPAMIKAGKKANELHHPVVLDPVGAGASALRTDTALQLMKEIQFSVIRGNISEIKTLALGSGSTRGVDADSDDVINSDNLEETVKFAKAFARKCGAVICITGKTDIIANSEHAYCVFNGDSMMSSVSGTGCQLTALITAFISANPDNIIQSCSAAVIAMGVCGEIAKKRLSTQDGNASYRNYMIDAMYHLNGKQLQFYSNYKEM